MPRWRTIIAPGLATWSPKILTPSRWPRESRPFFVLPAPFLWADSIVKGNGDVGGRGTVTDLGHTVKSPLRKEEEELEDKERPLNEPIRFTLIETVAIFPSLGLMVEMKILQRRRMNKWDPYLKGHSVQFHHRPLQQSSQVIRNGGPCLCGSRITSFQNFVY